jgi:hypothetical protein
VVPVQPQWDLLIIFTVSATGLMLYLGWLVSVVWKAFHPASGPTSALSSDSLADGPAREARLQTGQEV